MWEPAEQVFYDLQTFPHARFALLFDKLVKLIVMLNLSAFFQVASELLRQGQH